MKRWIIPLIGFALLPVLAIGCGSPAPAATPAATATPTFTPTTTPTPSVTREWDLEDIQVDGSTVRVRLHVFAGIDVRATLDGKDPEQVNALIPELEFVFQNVAVGKHTIHVEDVVGYEETAEIAVIAPGDAKHVSFNELFSDPGQYNGRDIILEGFYFQGWETTVLSEKLEFSGLAEGHLWPRGEMVWIEDNSMPREVYDQLYQQELIVGPIERLGKLRIEGRFEYGAGYGHGGGFSAQIASSKVELLPWSPTQQQ